MKKSTIIALSVVGGILLLIIIGIAWGVSARNSMVRESNEVDKVWGNVQTEYQRRMDLIPNLVATVKGYAKHEKETQVGVTAMRSGAQASLDKAEKELLDAQAAAQATPNGPDAAQAADRQMANMSRALDAFNVYVNAVHEAYPQLQASENFMDLQKELSSTANRVTKSQRDYNQAVTQYNNSIQMFPRSMVASMCGFQKKQTFQADAAAQKSPVVSFE